MKYVKEISHKDKLGFYRFIIFVEGENIIIKYKTLPNGYENVDLPDDKMHISQMHVANIPALVEAILKVFQMKEGGSVGIKENGDKIFAIMHFDDHGQFRELIVRDKSGNVTTGIDPSFEFIFEDYMSINIPPLPRTPTPAMIWVTDTLKKIYEEWEERKKGKKE